MNWNKLYELAFRYKKTKLWDIVWDTSLFAVELSGGRIGYVNIVGMFGEECALNLYIGEDGLNSFWKEKRETVWMLDPIEEHECAIQRNCLQCIFVGKEELSRMELEGARLYARAHQIRIAGKNAYPQFIRCRPYHVPWPLQTDEEQEDLCQALKAAIWLAASKGNSRRESLFLPAARAAKEILFLQEQGEGFTEGKITLGKETPGEWPQPKAGNDIKIARLKKARRQGVWECEIIWMLEAVREKPEDIPFFPAILMAVESSSGYILPMAPVRDYEGDTEELLHHFIDALLHNNICPKELKVRDERTFAFAKALCGRLKIKIQIQEELQAVREAKGELLMHIDMSEEEETEEIISMLQELLKENEGRLENLPPVIISKLQTLVEQNVLPKEMENKLNQAFHFPDKPAAGRAPGKRNGISYVVSVSLVPGCYRHIRISAESKLSDLHGAIIRAFGLDGGHAYAFFMDNKFWSQKDSYYMEGTENSGRTARYKLWEAGLDKGVAFKYLYDFGDEWRFQCKVLRTLEEETRRPAVIRKKGKAPKQYED